MHLRHPAVRAAAASLTILLLGTAGPAAVAQASAQASADQPPQGVAHRGDHERYEEETADALRSSIRLGLCNEVDVHLTKDNVPVLIHDATVDRTLNGSGRVRSFTAKQFLALKTPQGRHPITLQRGIEITRNMGGCMMVEVWHGWWTPERYAELGRMVRPGDDIWFDSWRRDVLAKMHDAAPSLRLAWKSRKATYQPAELPDYIKVVITDDSSRAMVQAHHAEGIQVWRERPGRNSLDLYARQGLDKVYTNSPVEYANHDWK